MTAIWLFHCNPAKFRIEAAIRASAPISNWAVKQHRDEIDVGDRAALYVSTGMIGLPPSVVGLGRVRSLAWDGAVDARFWIGGQPEPSEFVDISFDRFVFHHPVSRLELEADVAFPEGFPKMWQRTVVPLTEAQWDAIERRVAKRKPTTTPKLERSITSWNLD